MGVGRFNFGGGASSGALFPIHWGLSEPSKKEGLWIKSNDKVKDLYIANNNEPITKTWVKLDDLLRSYNNLSCCQINDKFYYRSSVGEFCSYDLKTGVTTIISANTPNGYLWVNVNGQMYTVYTSQNNSNGILQIFKYDFETGVTTRLIEQSVTSITWGNANAIAVGTNIYIFNGRSTSHSWKFDTLTNTLSGGISPGNMLAPELTSIGTDIYMKLQTQFFKLDTLRDLVTELTDFPNAYSYAKNPHLIAVEDTIYSFGGKGNSTSYYNMAFNKYDTITGLHTTIGTAPHKLAYSAGATLNNDIYIFGGDDEPSSLYKYKSMFNMTEGIYVFLDLNKDEDVGGYAMNKIHEIIRKVWLIKNNEKLDCECYIGDGTAWNLLNGGN